MAYFSTFIRTFRSHNFHSFLKHQNTSHFLSLQTPLHESLSRITSSFPSSIFQRSFSVTEERIGIESTDSKNSESVEPIRKSEKKKKKKPLDVLFKEAVGLSEEIETSSSSSDDEDESKKEIHELKKKLKDLEREIRNLKRGNFRVNRKNNRKEKEQEEGEISVLESKPNSLYSAFTNKSNRLDSVVDRNSKKISDKPVEMVQVPNRSLGLKPFKELSPEIVLLANCLYDEGYLKKANFLPPNKLELSRFSTFYSRDFLRSAAEKFGQDHQDILKSLSKDDLKRVALFGCPSVDKSTAFAAKRLRSFFYIAEDLVCRPCKLNSSCKVVNQRLWRKMDELSLVDVMRVLTLYGLELVPTPLEIPDEIKDSVNKLLREVVNSIQLGATTHD